jgi:uncharacterized protein YaeQ
MFELSSQERRRALPRRLIIGQGPNETTGHVALKLLAYVFFHRERLQIEVDIHMDSIPFVPDLVQLDYSLRPALWVECGECSVQKLNKLAVKAPETELWVVKKSPAEAESLLLQMAKEDLRRDKYNILALDPEMFEEIAGLIVERNALFWVGAPADPPRFQFDFNGLWFDAPYAVFKF